MLELDMSPKFKLNKQAKSKDTYICLRKKAYMYSYLNDVIAVVFYLWFYSLILISLILCIRCISECNGLLLAYAAALNDCMYLLCCNACIDRTAIKWMHMHYISLILLWCAQYYPTYFLQICFNLTVFRSTFYRFEIPHNSKNTTLHRQESSLLIECCPLLNRIWNLPSGSFCIWPSL